ncbi:hypothetical protein PRIPAC_97555 [Pristionchus pacificus]|uniref:Acyltransferase n=1 Tax=Pristionchus pacificus TaxID=54126 RepID=A0A2A6B2U5_PRIPA|nr:hypothetical protein PRIPAC_97555 [Pristionchus pacificus]|eukprot:PDM60192.1 Acyltransferase [Pristionchus pacificus]
MVSPHSKRPDIQTFRSLAISAVLAFHLRPDLFPLGYLGVDIFFVVSGYLMSMMLSRVAVMNTKSILEFYWRRISRILPIYAFVIFAVAVIARFILSPIDYLILIRDARWSLVFGANIEQYRDKTDYWAQVNDFPILLHMWSLGAEVQYYMIVPLIVILQRCFRRKVHQLIFLGALTIGSFASYAFFKLTDEMGSFLLMHNRIWQFTIGSIAFELGIEEESELNDLDTESLISKSEDNKQGITSSLIHIVFIVLSLICFSPVQIPICAPVSLFTGLLLLYGSQNEIGLLSNQLVVKFGNASYVLYLVHWPVITLYKYALDIKVLDHMGALVCLGNSIIISILLHELVEQKLLGCTKTILILVISLYAATLIVTSIELPSNTTTQDTRFNYTEVVHWNTHNTAYKGLGDCKKDKVAAKWALPYKEEENSRCVATGNGTARILIIGNSYAVRAMSYLRPLLFPIAKEVRLFAHIGNDFGQLWAHISGCRILIDGSCPPFAAAWPRVVEAMKPDVTWIISRDPELATSPLQEPIESDFVFQFAKNRLDFISIHSKHLVIDFQSVGIIVDKNMNPPNILVKEIQKKTFNFDSLHITEKKWKQFDQNETLRMDKIVDPKLIKHRISDKQCDSVTCFFYNPTNLHVYFGDAFAHQTPELMELLRPSYTDVIEQLKQRLKF